MLRGFWAKDELAVLKGFTSVWVDDGVDKLVAVAILGLHKEGVAAGVLALGGLVSSFQSGGVLVSAWWSTEIGGRFGLASWLGALGLGQLDAGAWSDGRSRGHWSGLRLDRDWSDGGGGVACSTLGAAAAVSAAAL
jgi:hypothetical protein